MSNDLARIADALDQIAATMTASHEAETLLRDALQSGGDDTPSAQLEPVAHAMGGGRMAGVVPLGALRLGGTLDVLVERDEVASVMWSRADGSRVTYRREGT